MNWPFGLYNAGMHNFILDEMELGTRVAQFLDEENNGWTWPWSQFLEWDRLDELNGQGTTSGRVPLPDGDRTD